jgi:hypothetical protein
MLEQAKALIESTFGKGALAVAGVFALGAVAMAKLPEYVVTPDVLKMKVGSVETSVAQVKKDQENAQRALEAQVINLRIDLLRQQRRQLASKPRLTPGEAADLKEMDEEIDNLRKKVAGISRV